MFGGLISNGELLFLSFFSFFFANGSELGMLAAVTDEVEGEQRASVRG